MFWENFYFLCNRVGKKPIQVVTELNIAAGSITKWKNGSVPRGKNLAKIADFFGVTVDYLLGNVAAVEPTTDDSQFYRNFKKICDQQGKQPIEIVRDLGIGDGSLTSWEAGHVPKWGTLYRLAGVLRVPLTDLIGDPASATFRMADVDEQDKRNIRMIPIYESVSAGFGAVAVDEVVDYRPMYIPNQSIAERTLFIKVKGDSMEPFIKDGNLIEVVKQDIVESGDIAVVLIDGEEGFVKRVIFGEAWIELHSFNQLYKTMRFKGDFKSLLLRQTKTL